MKPAFIFDLDGTLVNTQLPFHAAAECRVLAALGVDLHPEDLSKKFAGIPTRTVLRAILEAQGKSYDDEIIESLVKEKWRDIDVLIKQSDFSELDLLGSYVAELEKNGHPLAIASASPNWYVDEVCAKAPILGTERHLIDIFSIRVSADEVPRPKPAPDVFLEAARRLGVAPVDCVAVGDGLSDLRGGLDAGMRVIFMSAEEMPELSPEERSRVRQCRSVTEAEQALTEAAAA